MRSPNARTRRRPARPSHTLSSLPILLALALLAGGCRSSGRAELEPAEVAHALHTRALDSEEVASALASAALEPLGLERPSAAELADPRSAGYWRAAAWTWSPAVRRARRALAAAHARAGAAGQPEALQLSVDHKDLPGDERETELGLSFDLLGLFGLGRSAAARELAQAEERRALAELESALWSASFAVERARVMTACERHRVEELEQLAAQARADAPRIQILAKHGYASAEQAQWAAALLAELERRAAEARVAEAEARAELSELAGLPSGHASLSAFALEDVASGLVAAQAPASDVELVRAHPKLRALVLEHALAEARVRSTAAEWLPELRAGPKAVIMPDHWLSGGMLDLALAWPGALPKQLRAAEQERESAREAVEDALLAQRAELELARHKHASALAIERGPAAEVEAAAQAAWRAGRALFRNDSGALREWSMALEKSIEPLLARVDAHEAAALAALDWAELCGPPPRPAAAARAVEPGARVARQGPGKSGATADVASAGAASEVESADAAGALAAAQPGRATLAEETQR